MITTADFKNGIVVLLDNEIMEIVEFQHVKPGKGGAFVRTRFKNVLTGRVLDRTFRSGERLEEAELEQQVWQFLYRDGDHFHFMHPGTYEQTVVGGDVVGQGQNWLKDNTDVTLVFFKGKVIKVNVPISVVLRISQCDLWVQGDRATGGTKPAQVETGVTVQVPLFLSEGDLIKVDTRTGGYMERMSG